MAQEKILLFIPAYNCAPQIVRVLRSLNAIEPDTFAEVLVLNNQSTDDTQSAAVNVLSEVTNHLATVGRNSNNYGLGGSHKVAFRYASENGFTHVAILHGDDQGDIRDLLPILNSGDHKRLDACLGSRFMRGSQTPGYSLFRTVGNHVFNMLFSICAGSRVQDLGSGLNIFGPEVIRDQDILKYSDDLRFNCYLLLGLADKKRKFEFFPISWREEDQISNVRMVSQTIKTLAIVRDYLLSRRSFRTADHRTAIHPIYTFDVVGTNGRVGRNG
jgi:glycosyltransferase involved in cell wall biosynthesis